MTCCPPGMIPPSPPTAWIAVILVGLGVIGLWSLHGLLSGTGDETDGDQA